MPPRLVQALASARLADDPATKTLVGAYWLVDPDGDPARARQLWQEADIIGGVELGRWYPEFKDGLMFCVTETKTKEQIDALASALESLPCRAR